MNNPYQSPKCVDLSRSGFSYRQASLGLIFSSALGVTTFAIVDVAYRYFDNTLAMWPMYTEWSDAILFVLCFANCILLEMAKMNWTMRFRFLIALLLMVLCCLAVQIFCVTFDVFNVHEYRHLSATSVRQRNATVAIIYCLVSTLSIIVLRAMPHERMGSTVS